MQPKKQASVTLLPSEEWQAWSIKKVFETINAGRVAPLPAKAVQNAESLISKFASIAKDLKNYTVDKLKTEGIELSIATAIVEFISRYNLGYKSSEMKHFLDLMYTKREDNVERLAQVFNPLEIPLTERYKQFEKLREYMQNNWKQITMPHSSKKMLMLPCVCSGPGTGKTRGVLEFTKYLRRVESNMRIEHIYIDFSNGDLTAILAHQHLPNSVLMSLLILNKILRPKLNMVAFLALLDKLDEQRIEQGDSFPRVKLDMFSLESTIEYLQTEVLCIPPNEKLLFVVQIDDIQRGVTKSNMDTVEYKPTEKNTKWLRKFFLELMNSIKTQSANTLLFVVPTGVLDLKHIDLFSGTDYSVDVITMNNLSSQSCLNIVKERLAYFGIDQSNPTTEDTQIQAENLLQRVVLSIEGLPRGLEYVLKVMCDHIITFRCKQLSDMNFNNIFQAFKNEISIKYAAAFTRKNGIRQFITLAIAGQAVSKNSILHIGSTEQETVTVGDMDSVGIVFLRKNDGNMFTPYIPYIFLCLANEVHQMYDSKMFNFNSHILPEIFERYIQDRLYQNMIAFSTMNCQGNVALKYLIPGLMSSKMEDLEVLASSIAKYDVHGKFLDDFETLQGKINVVGQINPLDPLNSVCWVGGTSTVCDVACFLQSSYDNICILVREKTSNKNTKLSSAEFEQEYNNAMKFAKGEYGAQYRVVFVMVTNREVAINPNASKQNATGNMDYFAKKYRNAILVHYGNMDRFLGSFFKTFVTLNFPENVANKFK